jgi:hypothetical protein
VYNSGVGEKRKRNMKKEYNGHESKTAWNVSLWICNDESLYNEAIRCKAECKTLKAAASMFLENTGVTTTPDGYKYSHHTVKLAISNL